MAAGALGSVSNRLRHENGDTHVVVCDDVFSDAGSTPAASTISSSRHVQKHPNDRIKELIYVVRSAKYIRWGAVLKQAKIELTD